MSWLARSLANSLRLDDGDADDDALTDHRNNHSPTSKPTTPPSSSTPAHLVDQDEEEDPSRGVKEDLSELKQTLARQLLGVASFLAPPPTTPSSSQVVRSVDSEWKRCETSSDQYDEADLAGGSGIQRELSGFRDKAVTGFSKIASNLYSFGSSENGEEGEGEEEEEEEEEYGFRNAVGVTEEVLTFAMNIAMHPETWLDFPIEEEDDLEEFDMSDTQHEHALAVEHHTPRLAALRIELCPCHMSDGYFWKVYFVLLQSRLNKHDAELLLTPQIKAARALWMQELQKKIKEEQDWSRKEASYLRLREYHEDFGPSTYYDAPREEEEEEDMPFDYFSSELASFSGTQDFETEKHPIIVNEIPIIDKSVIEEKPLIRTDDKDLLVGPSPNLVAQNYDDDDDDDDDWLKDEDMENGGYGATILIDDEEDVSFSDLEDEGDIVIPVISKSSNRY